jgi:hypothetical protein
LDGSVTPVRPKATTAETRRTINRAAKPGERSRFINRAVQDYSATYSPDALRERLKQAALRDRRPPR